MLTKNAIQSRKAVAKGQSTPQELQEGPVQGIILVRYIFQINLGFKLKRSLTMVS